MDFGTCLVKYCLCLFNFVFVVLGITLLALGIWLAVDQSSIVSLLQYTNEEAVEQLKEPSVIEQLGFVFIALGAFIFIVSFLGYCGTIKESRFLLGAYAFFLTVIFVLEIVVVVLFVFYRKNTEMATRQHLTDSVHKFYAKKSEINGFTVTFDVIMIQGQCCGISNGSDFMQATKFWPNENAFDIPKACCKSQSDQDCPTSKSNSNYDNGCFTGLLQTITDKLNMAIIVGVILGLLQVIGIVFACCVYKASGYDDYK